MINPGVPRGFRRPHVRKAFHTRDEDVSSWLDLEPPPEVDGDGKVTNGAQRYGKSRGRTAAMVKRALRDADLSQSEAARKLGITQASMNAICTGRSIPAFGVAIELARLVGRPISEVCDLDEVAMRWREERDTRAASAKKLDRPKPKRAPAR